MAALRNIASQQGGGGGGGGGGGVVQQGARDATAQEWDVRFLSPQQVTLPNVEGVQDEFTPAASILIAGENESIPIVERLRTRRVGSIPHLLVTSLTSLKVLPILGSYVAFYYSLIDAPGTASAQRLLSIFNPANSGRDLWLLDVIVESYSVAASAAAQSLRLSRISAASGGTLVTPGRYNPLFGNASVAEVRIGNPTITVTEDICGFAPNQSITAAGTTGTSQRRFSPHALHEFDDASQFTIRPGTGIAFHFTGGQDADQRWNLHVVWGQPF